MWSGEGLVKEEPCYSPSCPSEAVNILCRGACKCQVAGLGIPQRDARKIRLRVKNTRLNMLKGRIRTEQSMEISTRRSGGCIFRNI